MKIDGTGYARIVQKLEKSKGLQKSDRRQGGKDMIVLSDASKKIKEYADAVDAIKASDIDKVETIKAKLASGTYKVSSKDLAKRILAEIKDQMDEGK